jgi:hypothetical protein
MTEDLRKALADKKVTVICPKYFGYEQKIVNRLVELGAAVFYIDERPSNSSFAKIVIRLFPLLYKIKINSYYTKKIKEMTPCDITLVINPECISLPILYRIKAVSKTAKFILYMWDSFSNKRKTRLLIPFFDKVLTFDPADAKKYHFVFRPLFFVFRAQKDEHVLDKYDISFIGTGHSDRIKIIKAIEEQCKEPRLRYFFYLYLQSPLIYLFHKITNKAFKKARFSDFHYKPLDYDEYIRITECSSIIIDIEHPKQNGLTIRTLEMLGKEKKLITTNSNVKEYDFYDPSNVYIINRNNPAVDIDFFEHTYKKLPEKLYYKYSIDGWLEDIFL